MPSQLINNFLNSIDYDNILYEPNRDKKLRYEIPASVLYAKCKLNIIDDKVHKLKDLLVKSQNKDLMWDEYAYGFEDEDIGFSGLVTTSYVLLALVEYYKIFNDNKILDILVRSADEIYFQENNGYIKKAKENKSNVLNTNLLGAIAIKEIAELLPKSSNRKRLYEELVRRVIRKVLSYQSLIGEFPYHFESKAVPILYQAMVLAELRYLLKYYNDEILYKAIAKGNQALKNYIKEDGFIDWGKANNHDKKGAMWVYSFSLATLDNKDILDKHIDILKNLSQNGIFYREDFGKIPDKFYSAWILFGLVWALDKQDLKYKYNFKTNIKYLFLKVEYFLIYFKFIFKYIKNRIYNSAFDSGALENRYWCKK